eukprot:maker-scaffold_53-snap-gene-1.12-mRNA-1 protein AED:0.01 eAED:0.01 QI:357/1/1/1/1/1/2/330/259
MAFIRTTDGPMKLPNQGPTTLHPHTPYETPITKHDFSPYDWNGGTIVAIAGKDYCVLAADTRLATGYSIKSRDIDRVMQLSPTTLIGCGGCHADVVSLYNVLNYKATMYKFDHEQDMSTPAAAQLVSNTLYQKRFFPYYCVPVVCGLDEEGMGYVTNYDVVGSFVRAVDPYTCNGDTASLVMPVLDGLLGTVGVTSGVYEDDRGLKKKVLDIKLDEAVEIMKRVFISVGERNIMCGDRVDIHKITKKGVEKVTFDLKRD